MYLYSLNNIHKIIKESDLLKSAITDRSKNLLIDKHNFIISSIIINAFKSDEENAYVNLYSQILKRILGDKYSQILTNLESLKIIEINNKYSVGKFSKSYRLNKNIADKHTIEKVGVLTANFRKKLRNELLKSNRSPVVKKIMRHTSNLKFINADIEYLADKKIYRFIQSSKGEIDLKGKYSNASLFRYEETSEALEKFNNYKSIEDFYTNNIFFTPTIAESGRIYHFVSSIPRTIRQCLRTKKGELIYEVDMASAQPSLLILEWIKSLYSSNNIEGEAESKMLLKLLYEGNIYKYISEHSSYFNSLEYSDLKKKILSTLYGKDNKSNENKELKRLFPNFMKWINNTKKQYGYKSVSLIGQKAEADIFVSVYKELSIKTFALIIHDSILTTEENIEEIKRQLINKLISQYPLLESFSNYNNVFKTSLVSLEDIEPEQQNKRKTNHEIELLQYLKIRVQALNKEGSISDEDKELILKYFVESESIMR